MKLELKRFSSQSDTTLGLLFVDGEFECFTLEDEYREEKVKGEPTIPAGTYKIEKREDGCLLVSDSVKSNRFDENNNLSSSGPAFKRLYQKMSEVDIINISVTDCCTECNCTCQ